MSASRRARRRGVGCPASLGVVLVAGWLAHDAVAGWLVDERVAGSLLAGGGQPSELAVAAAFLCARVLASLGLPMAVAMGLAAAALSWLYRRRRP